MKPDNALHNEAMNWLFRFTDNAAEAVSQQLKHEFKKWATQSAEHLRSFLDVASVYYAIGECETELVGELVAEIDEEHNSIVSLGPPRVAPVRYCTMRGLTVVFQIVVALISGVSGVCFLTSGLYIQDRHLTLIAAWTLLLCALALAGLALEGRTMSRWFHRA